MNKFFRQNKNTLIIFLLFFVVSMPLILPYFNNGYFPTHDGEWAVVRLADMFRTLKDLQFPARYSGALNFGYGYPLFNFAYPFPYYFGVLLYFFIGSFVITVKTIFAFSVPLSAFFMFFVSKKLWKDNFAALASSLFYIYFPYRMVDLYVRGSIGESLAFVLFPLILYFSLQLFDKKSSPSTIPLLSIFIAILIMTHNIMTVFFLPILILIVLTKTHIEKKYSVLKNFFLILILGMGISSFFWTPAIFEKNNIALSLTPIADRSLYFVNLKQLFIPSWGYNPPTESGGFSYQLGVSHSLIFLISVLVLFVGFIKNKKSEENYNFRILTFLVLLCILMMFSFTSFVWQSIPLLSEINYPWALLSQIGFLTSLLAGYLLIYGKYLKYTVLFLVFLSVVLTLPYAKPESFNNKGDQFYLTNEATTTSSDELMPVWVKEKPTERFMDKVKSKDAIISDILYNSKKISFNYSSNSNAEVTVSTIYYPGWNAYVNGKEVKINYKNSKGVMKMNVPEGSGNVLFKFSETPLRFFSDIISLISLFLVLSLFLKNIIYKK